MVSMLTGCGGAILALMKLGVSLREVISIEKSSAARDVFRTNMKRFAPDVVITEPRHDITEITMSDVQKISTNRTVDLVLANWPCKF